jgi:hypothetical protein
MVSEGFQIPKMIGDLQHDDYVTFCLFVFQDQDKMFSKVEFAVAVRAKNSQSNKCTLQMMHTQQQ